MPDPRAARIVARLKFDWSKSAPTDQLQDIASDAADGTLAGFGLSVATAGDLFHRANAGAVDWALAHAGELITQVSDSTREFVRAQVAQALDEGWSASRLKQEVLDGYAFSNFRALMISRSEVTNSYGAANRIAAKSAGMDQKGWLAADDSCDDCQENEDAGLIDIDEPYPSGDDEPGAHPS